jgi:hypothetical protein
MNSREYKLRKYQTKLTKGGTPDQISIYQNKITLYGGTCDSGICHSKKEFKEILAINQGIGKLVKDNDELYKEFVIFDHFFELVVQLCENDAECDEKDKQYLQKYAEELIKRSKQKAFFGELTNEYENKLGKLCDAIESSKKKKYKKIKDFKKKCKDHIENPGRFIELVKTVLESHKYEDED